MRSYMTVISLGTTDCPKHITIGLSASITLNSKLRINLNMLGIVKKKKEKKKK